MLRLPLLLVAGRAALLVRAQQTQATCPSSLSYLNNDLGQNPCVVLSTVFGVCTNNPNYDLIALGSQYSGYAGPTSTAQSSWNINRCLCSMPVYNLVMACETCQGKTVIPFSQFTASCGSSFVGTSGYPILELPVTLPDTTALASWVNIDNTNHLWSLAEVSSQASTSASSSASSSSSSTSPSTSSGQSSSSSPSSSTTSGTSSTTSGSNQEQTTGQSSGSDSGHDNTGAIVGGTVGGIALIGVIGLGALYLVRTNKRNHSAYSRSITNWQQDQSPSPFHAPSSTGSHRAPSASWFNRPIQDNPPLSPQGSQGVAPSVISYAPYPSQTPAMARQYSGHQDPGMWGRPTPAPPAAAAGPYLSTANVGGGGGGYPSPHSPQTPQSTNGAYDGMFNGHAEVQEERW